MSAPTIEEKPIARGTYAKKKGEIILREHEYDGIQEYDQRLPNWWLFTLYIMIVWFIAFWLIYYNLGLGKSPSQRIDAQMSAIAAQKEKNDTALLAKLDDATLIEWSKDSNYVSEGKTLYMNGACNGCHGPNLSGVINGATLGRSLVDGEWAYGNKPLDVFHMISNGTPVGEDGLPQEGAGLAVGEMKMIMPAQKFAFTGLDIAKITAFLIKENPKDFADY